MKFGSHVGLKKTVNPFVVGALAFFLVLGIGVYQYHSAIEKLQLSTASSFQKQHEEFMQELQNQVKDHIHELSLLALAIQQQPTLSPSYFSQISQKILLHHSEISAVEWLPKIEHAQRDAHEQSLIAQGYPNYHISQIGQDGQTAPAREKSHYFPIMFVEPFARNHKVHGLDVTSRPFNEMMIYELETGSPYAFSPPFQLLQDGDQQKSILIYMPVKKLENDDLNGVLLFAVNIYGLLNKIKQQHALPAEATRHLTDVSLYSVEFSQYGSVQKSVWLDNKMYSYKPKIKKSGFSYPSYIINHKEVITFEDIRWEMRFYADLKEVSEYQEMVKTYRQNIFLFLFFGSGIAFLLAYLINDYKRFLRVKGLLKFEQNRLYTLFNKSSDLYLLLDTQGRIVDVNQKACETLGYTRDALLNYSYDAIWSDGTLFYDALQSLKLGDKFEGEETLIGRDGSKIVVNVTVVKIQSEPGVRYSCLLNDVTLYKKQMESLELAAQQAEAAGRLKSEFLANMSHELRTPLHGIISFAALGEERDDDAKLKSYFSAIRSSGERLLKMLTEILELSKIESSEVSFNFQKTEFNRLVNIAVKEQMIEASRKQIQLSLRGDSTDILLDMDEGRVLQVLANLISNAIKFTPEEGRIEIEWRLKSGFDSHIYFCIRNEGEGLLPDELEDIFDKFVQKKRHTLQVGTGLGLSISREIIQKHRGKIWAESEEQHIAKFCFTIPIKQIKTDIF